MTNPTSSIFGKPTFGAEQKREADQRKAAQGFGQIFATILARQMRQSLVGANKGPLGIGGGTSGSIYGAFFDEAMGKVLAHSPAWRPLNRLIERQLAGPRKSAGPANGEPGAPGLGKTMVAALDRAVLLDAVRDETAAVFAVGPGGTPATSALQRSDAHGPLLLPPVPSSMAQILLPPPAGGK